MKFVKKIILVSILIMLITPVLSFAQSTIRADEVIDKINRGKNVYYKDVIIKGDLDFTKINDTDREDTNVFRSYVNSSITFIDCTLNGEVIAYKKSNQYYYKTMFQRNVTFKDTKFKDVVNFRAAQFTGIISFSGSVFNENVSFRNAQCIGYANFKSTEFNNYANFKNVQFIGKADFNNVAFDEDYSFSGATLWNEPFNPINNNSDGWNNDNDDDWGDNDDSDGNITTMPTEIEASEIINKLNNNKNIYYENVIIKGDLDFTTVANTKKGYSNKYVSEITKSLTFKNCTIKGRVIAYHEKKTTIFKAGISFYGTKIQEYVNFENSEFMDYVDFSNAEFQNVVNFSNIKFNKIVNFIDVKFKRGANFNKSRFENNANFSNSEFSYKANFSWVFFNKDADFSNVKFSVEADFFGVSFFGDENFKGATLDNKPFKV